MSRLNRVLACIAAATLALGASGQYTAARLSDDTQTLTIATSNSTVAAPLTAEGQVGFRDPIVSSNGTFVGWLALTPNCCTSYPLPTSLVLFADGEVIQTFDAAPPIWGWTFSADNTAVAYRQEFPHGALPVRYVLRRVADGRILAEFTCDPRRPATSTSAVPTWAERILGSCATSNASALDSRQG